MTIDDQTPRQDIPRQNPRTDIPRNDPPAIAPRNDTMTRILGGSPLAVLGRLVLICILVGVILSALGIDPTNIWSSLRNFVLGIWDMGFDALRGVWRYFLLGAVIVIPIWLLMRLANARKVR